MKRIVHSILAGILTVVVAVGTTVKPGYAIPVIAVQSWCLLDTGGHLDWRDGGTRYLSSWLEGIALWEDCRSGVIREDTAWTINDVTLSDVDETNDINATTYTYGVAGAIKFNIHNMEKLTAAQKMRVAAHECGHALGVDHLGEYDMMYKYTPQVDVLSESDKASYHTSYYRVTTGSDVFSASEVLYENSAEGIPVLTCSSSYCIDIDNLAEVVGHADYVFVGTVNALKGVEYRHYSEIETEHGVYLQGIPYSLFEVSVAENIKGSLQTDSPIEVYKHGGLDQSGQFYIMNENDIIPEQGKTYVFVAYAQPDGSLLVCGANSTVESNIASSKSIDSVYQDFCIAAEQQAQFDRERYVSKYEISE